MGSMRGKTSLGKNDLSIEGSNVTRVVSLGSNNQAKDFKESGDMPEEASQYLDIYFTMFTHYLDLFFKRFYSLDVHPFRFVFALNPDCSIRMD